MKFKKFLFVAFLLLVCIFPSFSLGGVLADSSTPLHVIRTEYFDIIFPEECRESAQKIEAVCDDYYLEITSLLETQAWQRFPVTITRSVEQLNAYYAAIPYNRIVLYDTLPENSLDSFSDTIQSVFYHELTHAVTYNMKSGVLKALSFFADCMNPAWLTVTTFWAEGATVSFESKKNGGRLNNPFATQIVNQSKIEGCFPSWRDVTGARDTYPGGTDAYMFGSMFASYLQETYGMSRYAEFWKTAGSKISLTFIAGVFKKVYNKSISEVWKEFEKTLEIDSGEKNARCLSHRKGRITTFDVYQESESGEVKIAFFDAASASLRLLTLSGDGKIKKNKKLLAVRTLSRIAFSPDGKKLALSRYVDKKNVKAVLAEYDLVKKRYTEYSDTALRDGYFRLSNGAEKLEGVKIEGGRAGGNAVPLLNEEEIPFSPLAVEDNLSAAIIKEGLKWKIRLFDSNKVLYDYDFSSLEIEEGAGEASIKNLILHNLHFVSRNSDSLFLSFSWAYLGMGGKMLSRAGMIKIQLDSGKALAFLQKRNSFAGITNFLPSQKASECLLEQPASGDINPSTSFFVYVSAAEYDRSPLYCLEMTAADFNRVAVNSDSPEINSAFSDLELSSTQKKEVSGNELSYNPFRYYKRGVFIPLLGLITSYSHDFEADSTTLLGMTFVSTNPWGDRQFSFTGGYDPLYKNGGLQLGLSGGNDSFKYDLNGSCLFDGQGFMQTFDSLQLVKRLWSGKVSTFEAGGIGNFLYGRQICNDELEKGRDDSTGKSADAMAYIQFSSIHQVSPAYFRKAGFLLQPFVLASYRDTEKRIASDEYLNGGAKAQIQFPLIFPLIFNVQLFPARDYVAGANASAVLADFEIHRGIPALSIFVQRFVLSVTYEGKVSYVHKKYWDIKNTEKILRKVKKNDYSDALKFCADFYLTPNTGVMANGLVQFMLGGAMIYRPNPALEEKRLVYGITGRVNY